MKIPKKDYYKILQVAPIDSIEDISRKYKILARKYHPDLQTSPQAKKRAQAQYQVIVEAYQVLKNKEKRAEYDNLPIFRFRDVPRSRMRARQASKSQEDMPWWKKLLFLGISKRKEDPRKKAETFFSLARQMADNPKFLDQAIKEFQKAYDYDNSFVEALYNIALCYYKKGEFDKAVEYLKMYSEKVPDDKLATTLISMLSD